VQEAGQEPAVVGEVSQDEESKQEVEGVDKPQDIDGQGEDLGPDAENLIPPGVPEERAPKKSLAFEQPTYLRDRVSLRHGVPDNTKNVMAHQVSVLASKSRSTL
jgi:hypothetical protein